MLVTLTKIVRKERVSKKSGRPYTSIGIKTSEYGDKFISGFGNTRNRQWREGDKVEIEVQDTGEYLNFTMPEAEDSGPAASNGATSEIKNILMLKVIPKLEQMQKDMIALDGRIALLLQRNDIETDDPPIPDFGEDQ